MQQLFNLYMCCDYWKINFFSEESQFKKKLNVELKNVMMKMDLEEATCKAVSDIYNFNFRCECAEVALRVIFLTFEHLKAKWSYLAIKYAILLQICWLWNHSNWGMGGMFLNTHNFACVWAFGEIISWIVTDMCKKVKICEIFVETEFCK